MKKEFKIAFILMLLLLLVGCGAKEEEEEKTKESTKVKDGIRVECTKSETNFGMKMNVIETANYKKNDDSFVSLDVAMNMDYSDALSELSEAEKKEAIQQMDDSIEDMKDIYAKQFASPACDGKNQNSKLSITCSTSLEDFKKADSEDLETYESKDKFIEKLEKDGFTCKTTDIHLEK